jgi:hypothetical protein
LTLFVCILVQSEIRVCVPVGFCGGNLHNS